MPNKQIKRKFSGFRITTVGDDNVHKTSLLAPYDQNEGRREYVPQIIDIQTRNLTVDGSEYCITLWDTTGQEKYTELRRLSYPKTDCFLLCYSIDNRETFANIRNVWYPEIRYLNPNVPIILVGINTEMRLEASTETKCITTLEGLKLKNKIKAYAFIECSVKTMENLPEVFSNAVRAIRINQHSRINCESCAGCNIM